MTRPALSTFKEDPSEWLKLAQSGDSEAYRQFLEWVSNFTQSMGRILLLKWNIKSPEALDDLIQEVLLAVHLKKHTYIPELPVEPWVATIVRHKTVDWLRKVTLEKKRIADEDLESIPIAADRPEVFGAHRSTQLDLDKILSSLSKSQRALIEWVKIEGLSIQEVAAKTDRSEVSVKVSVHRILKGLQKQFGGAE